MAQSESGCKKVAILGSGNWGSAIARIIGANVVDHPDFDNEVKMWVFEEMVNGKKLTEIINEKHENVKYLPGFRLPDNVIACPDPAKTVEGADILIFVLPHQFVRKLCKDISGSVKNTAFGISLIKGMDSENGIQLISDVINSLLKINVSVLMGANIASDVASGDFCEATIGCKDPEQGRLLKLLINRQMFRITVVPDVATVELCGALKNVVAVAAGFCDGLKYGVSTKAAIIRIGLLEMWKFITVYYEKRGLHMSTLLESCGIADVFATCSGGRNRRVSEAFVASGKTIEVLEAEMLNGQKLQGPLTAKEVHDALMADKRTEEFPLMTAVYQICYEGLPVADLVQTISKL